MLILTIQVDAPAGQAQGIKEQLAGHPLELFQRGGLLLAGLDLLPDVGGGSWEKYASMTGSFIRFAYLSPSSGLMGSPPGIVYPPPAAIRERLEWKH